jgi:hypothetical protein
MRRPPEPATVGSSPTGPASRFAILWWPGKGVFRVGGRSYWFSGFCFARVKGVGRGSSAFTVPCMVCRGRVFGLNRRPFWYESDRGGAFSGFLSVDGLVFRFGLYDPPSPLSVEGLFFVSFSGEGSYFR